jgi:endonuclease YncB( thermonuclease family)
MVGIMSRTGTDDPATAKTKLLRQRRIVRGLIFGTVAFLGLSVFFDHLGAFGYAGDDWRHFDHNSVVVTRVIDGDTICVRGLNGSRETHVRLLGVDAPELHLMTTHVPDYWADRARSYAAARMTGKTVTLRTEPTETRDRYGRLLAYVYLTDSDNVNLDLVHDGQAYADRRFKHSLRGQFEQAENESRKKRRGLWEQVKEDQMPPWRQRWLAEWKRHK